MLKEKITTNNKHLLNNKQSLTFQDNSPLKLYKNIAEDKRVKEWYCFKNKQDQIQ